jgi:two-component system CheB/CheR fusion protein
LTVVGIGASAGGLEALKKFFLAMPVVPNVAFVVVQHLDPNHPSRMAEILAKLTPMRVVEADDDIPIEAGCVYTIPAGKFLQVRDSRLHLAEIVKQNGVRTPIDYFFRSLAADVREKAVCVVLSGTGSDGTHGLRAVRGTGGMAMAQAPETAEYDAMPRSAIATHLVDHILPPPQMPQALLGYLGRATSAEPAEETATAEEDELHVINSILGLVAARTKNDFRCYKKSTIRRRIERRMGLKRIRSIPDYFQFLRDNSEEADALAKDMLISVTSFFREPEAFEEIRGRALAPLVQGRGSEEPLRIWVPGCATGEEVYSIAMLAQEALWAANTACRLQVFASDIDADALQVARLGIYPECVAADVSEERLKRFFVPKDQTYQVDKQLRESIVFTLQNVLSDPPFSRVDLVSCRNLLIYLEPEAQKQVLAMFAFALRPGGYLFLGKSDSISGQDALFEPVSRAWRLYRRTDVSPLQIAGLRRLSDSVASRPLGPRLVGKLDQSHLAELNQQVLLKLFAAAVLLTDSQGEILHFFGPTEKYLSHPTGQANFDLFSMIRADLTATLRAAVRAAAEEKQTVRLKNVPFGHPGQPD